MGMSALIKDAGRSAFGYHFAVFQRPEEKRRYGRVHLSPPLPGEFDGIPIEIIELSVSGLRIRHELRLLQIKTHRVRFTWNGRSAELKCELVRTTISGCQEGGQAALHQSGIRIWRPGPTRPTSCGISLRSIVRSINEQLASARRPTVGGRFVPSGKAAVSPLRVRGGIWRRAETSDEQARHGFTIPAEVSPYRVGLLLQDLGGVTKGATRARLRSPASARLKAAPPANTCYETSLRSRSFPPELVADPDRVRRFAQEARTASALNHPHLIVVHDIGTFSLDGQDLHFIAMEKVDCTTLRDTISAGPLPIEGTVELMLNYFYG
jgi:hypothetical protein